MAVTREHPYTGAHFRVNIGDQGGSDDASGFAEVVFPTFRVAAQRGVRSRTYGPDPGPGDGAGAGAGEGGLHVDPNADPNARSATHAADTVPTLVLRRGVTGRLDLCEWWDRAVRDEIRPARTVTIELLADDHRTVVLTWRFVGAYPVTLAYSPLNAMANAVVMEEVALAFERVEIS